MPPIIFEECFVKDEDPQFVEVVAKATNELSEAKIVDTYKVGGDQVLTDQQVGVHLFILVHGF